ncbi:RDD family protein [Clostridium sp. NSJ-49]|uniref:RDD family protein n=1 Tax=Clostridium TaxID=1485 RepID=UPI00164C47D9|nr:MULTISPECIES: RDD family protein [unclassified Clostridium]MBC5625313.1 RDD family protein [Clostridium sp. NSJ-49]MCD2501424.1 RDD family protein [Clostridium sp. NSJ-145]
MAKNKKMTLREKFMEYTKIKKVSKVKRAVAFLADWYISTLLAGIPLLYMYSVQSGSTEVPASLTQFSGSLGVIAGLIGVVIITLYYVVVPLKFNKGQTLAKNVLGVKIVQNDGSEVTAKSLIKREILGVMLIEAGLVSSSKYLREIFLIAGMDNVYRILAIVAIVIPFISIVIMMFNKESKMIHDIIGGTKVVNA